MNLLAEGPSKINLESRQSLILLLLFGDVDATEDVDYRASEYRMS